MLGNLIAITDLSEGQRRQVRDFALRLRLLRERRQDLFVEAMKRCHEFAVCVAEPAHIAKQLSLFGRVLADLEAEAEVPVPVPVPVQGVDNDGARDGDDHDGDLHESIVRLGIAWAARVGGRTRR
jgi:hypothetical protein